MALVGLSCKLFINTGTYAAPTWTEVTIARDVAVNLEATEAEASSRASTWKEFLVALKDASVEFDILYEGADTNLVLIRDAFLNGTDIEILAFDGASATVGNQGLRATCKCFAFSRNEPMEEAVTNAVTMKPTPNSDAAPAWFTAV